MYHFKGAMLWLVVTRGRKVKVPEGAYVTYSEAVDPQFNVTATEPTKWEGADPETPKHATK